MSDCFDVCIVGAGPAGLTAALYAARSRMKIKLYEANIAGGQIMLTDWISNYPGFPGGVASADLVSKIQEQISSLGVCVETKKVDSIQRIVGNSGALFKLSCESEQALCRSVIIATGASPKRLEVSGEKELTGKGVSYCGLCDAPLFKGKTVAVIGGGNAAIEEAIFLSRFVKKIFLIHRRDTLRATAILQEQVRGLKNSELVLNAIPLKILGKERVKGIEIKDVRDNRKRALACEGVFIFVGQIPNTDLIKTLVKLDDNKYVIVDNRMCTSAEGIFACGDCISKDLRQFVSACADGAQAAYSAHTFLGKT
jgi:thioredoxin reductase (NADPH)